MYGLRVASDFALATGACAEPSVVDVTIRRVTHMALPHGEPHAELRCQGPCHGGAVYSRVYRRAAGSWLVKPGVAACFVTATGERVDVCAENDANERDLGLLLAGELSTLLLQQRGRPCLHASAVALDAGAVAFVGPQGRGKSTMAANFLSRGDALLTDDVLALRLAVGTVEASPGLPMMKLWPRSVEHTLHLREELPNVVARMDKKLLSMEGRYAHETKSAVLRGIFVLERYDPARTATTAISVRRLSGREAIAALLMHTSHLEFLLPRESAALLGIYARLATLVPIRALRFPDGFQHQPAVHAEILASLAAP
jgi:hypothetical protein